MDDDFRFDLRFSKSSDVTLGVCGGKMSDSTVINIRSDRLAYSIQRPHVGIGEAYFSTNRQCPLVDTCLMY